MHIANPRRGRSLRVKTPAFRHYKYSAQLGAAAATAAILATGPPPTGSTLQHADNIMKGYLVNRNIILAVGRAKPSLPCSTA